MIVLNVTPRKICGERNQRCRMGRIESELSSKALPGGFYLRPKMEKWTYRLGDFLTS